MKNEKIKNYLFPLAIIIVIVAIDILTKFLVVDRLGGPHRERLDFLDGFLRISLVYNNGFVFGLGQGYKNVALAIAVVVLALMIVYYVWEKNKSTLFMVSMALISSGAIGNILDRLVPGRPGVVDFISIGVDRVYRWPSFNVADSSIVIGALLLIIVFYGQEMRRKREQKA
jgi:signal peptidase II